MLGLVGQKCEESSALRGTGAGCARLG